MLTDVQLERYADVLIWALKVARKDSFKRDDTILLQYNPAALRLAEILYVRILDMGMNPVQRMGLTINMERGFYEKATNRQLVFLTPGDRNLYGSINGRIFLHAPDALTHLKDIDPAKIGKALIARKPLRDIMNKREEKGHYSWTLCTLPTEELAKQARMTHDEYAQQIIKACYLDFDNPISQWQKILTEVRNIKKWLSSLAIKSIHIESNSVDLTIAPGAKRVWIGISGHNVPSFEIFTSPDWRGTEGRYFANLPSFRSGNYVEGVRLLFKKGNAIEITAEMGEDFVRKQLAMDRGARRIGEFSLTDKRFSRIDRFMADTLFDENHGGEYGNCHVALGSSYTVTYDGNPSKLTKGKKKEMGFNDSALHWDLVNTEDKTVTAQLTSGEKVLIYENGMFKC
ncbi:MAG TPA: aminopeptidase [Syntrophales bacterium]|nr:aminopeptidase [Syntrophales bacterium]